jgi:Trk-type K+ transport system membrane component
MSGFTTSGASTATDPSTLLVSIQVWRQLTIWLGGFDVLDLVFASASTLGNAGFGLGPAGPTGSFAAFGDGSTVAMTLLMWVGRLEILPVLVLLRRSYWRL